MMVRDGWLLSLRRNAIPLFLGCVICIFVVLVPEAQAGGLPAAGKIVPLEEIDGAVAGTVPTAIIGGIADRVGLARAFGELERTSNFETVYVLGVNPDVVTKALNLKSGIEAFESTPKTKYVISYVRLIDGEKQVGSYVVVGPDSEPFSSLTGAGILEAVNDLTKALETPPPQNDANYLAGKEAVRTKANGARSAAAYGDDPLSGYFVDPGDSSPQYVNFQDIYATVWGRLELSNSLNIVWSDGWDDRDFWTAAWWQQLYSGDYLYGNDKKFYQLRTRYTRVHWSQGNVDRSIHVAAPPYTDVWDDEAYVQAYYGWDNLNLGCTNQYLFQGWAIDQSSLPTYAEWVHWYNPNADLIYEGYGLTLPGFNEVVPQNEKFAVDVGGTANFWALSIGFDLKEFQLPTWRFTKNKPGY